MMRAHQRTCYAIYMNHKEKHLAFFVCKLKQLNNYTKNPWEPVKHYNFLPFCHHHFDVLWTWRGVAAHASSRIRDRSFLKWSRISYYSQGETIFRFSGYSFSEHNISTRTTLTQKICAILQGSKVTAVIHCVSQIIDQQYSKTKTKLVLSCESLKSKVHNHFFKLYHSFGQSLFWF